jgi:FlaA1/EpsC-like NDP-sugar epimerase
MVMGLDLSVLCLAQVIIHIALRWILPEISAPSLTFCLIIALPIGFLVFWLTRTHTGIIRFSNFRELSRIFMATLLLHIVLMGVSLVIRPEFRSECAILLLPSFFLTYLGMSLSRFVMLELYESLMARMRLNRKRCFVWGVDSRSVSQAEAMRNDSASPFLPVAYITREKKLLSKRAGSIPAVWLSDKNAVHVLRKFNIKAVVFTDQKTISDERDLFIKKCVKYQIAIYLAPPVEPGEFYQPSHRNLRRLNIEDLLGRPEIQINAFALSSSILDKVLLVTGAAGSIGSELVRQIAPFKPRMLVLLDIAETPLHYLQLELEERYPELHFKIIVGDVRNQACLRSIFKKYSIECVYHAAAYKHVPLMEFNPCEAVLTNVGGTRNLINFSVRYKARHFVMISTDKAVNPTNVMGASKRIAEIYVQSLSKYLIEKDKEDHIRCVTTRFGNVLGSNGSVIPRFQEQIEKGGPITVTHPEVVRYFMSIPEACRLVLEAGSFGNNGEIYVFDMGEPVRIADLAERMVELAGLVPNKDIQIKYTGLRPGEKLFEELLSSNENTIDTHHPKIKIALVERYDLRTTIKNLNELIAIAQTMDAEATLRKMKAIVPEYIAQNAHVPPLEGSAAAVTWSDHSAST